MFSFDSPTLTQLFSQNGPHQRLQRAKEMVGEPKVVDLGDSAEVAIQTVQCW